MKTRLHRMAAMLAVTVASMGYSAQLLQADDVRVSPSSRYVTEGGAAPQQPPYYAGGPAGAAYADSGAYAPGTCPCDGGDCGVCGCSDGHGPFLGFLLGGEFRVSANAVFLGRGAPRPQALLRDAPGLGVTSTSNNIFDAQDLHFSSPIGFTVGGTYASPYGVDLECTFTRVDDMHAIKSMGLSGTQSVLTLTGSEMLTPFFIQTDKNGASAIFPVFGAQLDDSSEFQSGELNTWFHVGDRVRLLLGFRWVEFTDTYSVFSFDNVAPTPNLFTLNNFAVNDLFGVQIGGSVTVLKWGSVSMDFTGKAGAYNNYATQRSRQTAIMADGSVPLDQVVTASDDRHTAFVGDLDITGVWEVMMDRLYFRAGYQVIWLDGVLTAPGQIGGNDFAANTAGLRYDTALFHGVHVGAELRF